MFIKLALIILLSFDLSFAKVIEVTSTGAKCDGHTDDSNAIQKAFDQANSGDSIEFPSGKTCVHTKAFHLKKKDQITIFGHGPDSSKLDGIDPKNSAIVIEDSHDITIKDFRRNSPNTKTRVGPIIQAAGFNIRSCTDLHISNVVVYNAADVGIMNRNVSRALIENVKILSSRADGITMISGCRDITLQNNYAEYTGDDSFSSVGYTPSLNHNIKVLNCKSFNGHSSGLTIGGVIGYEARGVEVINASYAPIRFESSAYFKDDKVEDVLIHHNTIKGGPRDNVDLGGIWCDIGYKASEKVTIENNNLIDINGQHPIKLTAKVSLKHVIIRNNKITSRKKVKSSDCIYVVGDIADVKVSNNTLDNGSCQHTKVDHLV